MTDRYQDFVQSPIGRLLVKNLGLPAPVPLERYAEGDPLVTGTVPDRWQRAGWPESLPGLLDVLERDPHPAGGPRHPLPRPGPRRHRPHRLLAARRAARLLRPADAQPRDLPSPGRHRHPARDRRRSRARRPARSRGLHPLARQGGRPRRDRPARVRRRGCDEGGLLSTLAFLLSPKSAYVSGQVVRIGTTPDHTERRRGDRLAAPARGQGRAGHRRQPRHRRADRPRAAPRRRHRDRRRRPTGGRPAGQADQRARRRLPRPRHHGEGRAATHRPPGARPSTAASTSSSTTPASPATRSSPTWPRTAGTR